MSNQERIARKVGMFDAEMHAHGMPSYTELVRELGATLKELDALLDKAGKPRNLYAAVAREHHNDALRKLGNVNVTHI